jgi:hypothetical protein
MVESSSPARIYRKAVRSFLESVRHKLPPSSDAEIELEAYLDALYTQLKEQLTQLVVDNTSEAIIQGEKVGIFIIASGLFAFGHLDVAHDILSGIPSGQADLRRLAWVLKALLPMPKYYDPLINPSDVQVWLIDWQDRLQWDGKLEKFVVR